MLTADQATASLDYDLSKQRPALVQVLLPERSGDQALRLVADRRVPGDPEQRLAGAAHSTTPSPSARASTGSSAWATSACVPTAYDKQTVCPIQPGPDLRHRSADSTGLICHWDYAWPDLLEFATNVSTDSPAPEGRALTAPEHADQYGYYQNRLNPSTNVIFSGQAHHRGGRRLQLHAVEHRQQPRRHRATSKRKTSRTFSKGEAYKSNVHRDHRSASGKKQRRPLLPLQRSSPATSRTSGRCLPNLSITAGVRYDYHGGMTEKYGNMFNFDPSLYNVTGTTPPASR